MSDSKHSPVKDDDLKGPSADERSRHAERFELMRRFASQIAHEIRNPLSAISLNIEMLEDQVQHSEEARRLIRAVLNELDHLNEVIEEHLQFRRFPRPQLQRGNLEPVLDEVALSLRLPPSVKFEAIVGRPLPDVWLDVALFRQALDNLLRNGLEALDGAGTLRLETEIGEQFLAVRVKDTGKGISPEIVHRIFEPFFTTKAQRPGLGLATAQEIIFEHNGHIQVESQSGQGSTFTIYLPT